MILEILPVGPYETNCYIYASSRGGKALIIDPGDGCALIWHKTQAWSLDVACIALTHGHRDHTGALKELKEATGAEIVIHTADADLLQDEALAAVLGLRTPCPPKPDKLLEDGQKITLGEITLTVLHTPGHSGGSICLLGDGLVFTGDTLFQDGIGRTDFPGGSYTDIVRSIRTRLLSLPDDTRIYPGHGPPTTIGDERRYNPFLK